VLRATTAHALAEIRTIGTAISCHAWGLCRCCMFSMPQPGSRLCCHVELASRRDIDSHHHNLNDLRFLVIGSKGRWDWIIQCVKNPACDSSTKHRASIDYMRILEQCPLLLADLLPQVPRHRLATTSSMVAWASHQPLDASSQSYSATSPVPAKSLLYIVVHIRRRVCVVLVLYIHRRYLNWRKERSS
jgi:hypothetical protein